MPSRFPRILGAAGTGAHVPPTGRWLVAATHDGTAAGRFATVVPALCAVAFGLFLIYGVGFSHSSTLHNAAHDQRHAVVFPCH